MNQPSPPVQERRSHRRLSLDKVRVRLVSGELDDLSRGVNFAKRLVNVGLGGACIETIGRLRPDVKMFVEIRFDEFGGTLRSEAQAIWTDMAGEKGLETHLMGVSFVKPELTNAVREYFDGGRASAIISKRRAEYEELKAKSTARKAGLVARKGSAAKKTLVALLVLILLYVAGFVGLIAAGRTESQGPGIRYRYLGREGTGGGEEALAKAYLPLYWVVRKAGIDLTYDPVPAPKP